MPLGCVVFYSEAIVDLGGNLVSGSRNSLAGERAGFTGFSVAFRTVINLLHIVASTYVFTHHEMSTVFHFRLNRTGTDRLIACRRTLLMCTRYTVICSVSDSNGPGIRKAYWVSRNDYSLIKNSHRDSSTSPGTPRRSKAKQSKANHQTISHVHHFFKPAALALAAFSLSFNQWSGV